MLWYAIINGLILCHSCIPTYTLWNKERWQSVRDMVGIATRYVLQCCHVCKLRTMDINRSAMILSHGPTCSCIAYCCIILYFYNRIAYKYIPFSMCVSEVVCWEVQEKGRSPCQCQIIGGLSMVMSATYVCTYCLFHVNASPWFYAYVCVRLFCLTKWAAAVHICHSLCFYL